MRPLSSDLRGLTRPLGERVYASEKERFSDLAFNTAGLDAPFILAIGDFSLSYGN